MQSCTRSEQWTAVMVCTCDTVQYASTAADSSDFLSVAVQWSNTGGTQSSAQSRAAISRKSAIMCILFRGAPSPAQGVRHALTHSVNQSPSQSLSHPPTHPPTHSLTHSLTHSPSQPSSHAATHSLSHPLTLPGQRAFTAPPCRSSCQEWNCSK